jgi:hypothetical protein
MYFATEASTPNDLEDRGVNLEQAQPSRSGSSAALGAPRTIRER